MKDSKKIISKDGKLYYQVRICGVIKDLPLLEVAPNLKIAVFNILGETSLVGEIAKALAKKLPKKAEVIITPELKSVCLAYELSKVMAIPYIIVRKTCKPYMLNSIKEEVLSITTGKPQNLWLDGKDKELLKGKKAVILDDVISTGSTLKGMRGLLKKAGGALAAEAAVFTEGEKNRWKKIISLGHLPIFK